MTGTKGARALMCASAMAAIAMIGAPAAVQAQEAVYQFAIPAQDLASALRAYGRTTKRQIVFNGQDARKVRSAALRGRFGAADAIAQLLRGTGFVARNGTAGVVIVEREAGTGPTAASGEAPAAGDDGADIVVTGTNIRGQAPIGSPLTVVTREDIAKSGYGRIQDYLETLPSNFSGSTSEDSNIDFNGDRNTTRGQGVNLRGIGAGSTLVLVNGRRPAPGGLIGGFVDISSLPAQAIERIEILTDGASALYGSDAVGGVVNFILRRDYEGLETSVRLATIDGGLDELQASVTGGFKWDGGNLMAGYAYSHRYPLYNKDRFYASLNTDFRSLGGNDFRPTFGNPGTIIRSGQPSYAIPRGQDGTALTVAQLTPGVNYRDQVTGITSLGDQETHSVFASASQELSSSARLFADGRFGKRFGLVVAGGSTTTVSVPSTNPYYVNPYGGTAPVQVQYDFTGIVGRRPQNSDVTTYSINAGAEVDFAENWRLNLTGSYGRERTYWENLNGIDSTRRNACLSGVATPAQCPGRPLNVFGDGRGNDPVTIDFIRDNDETVAVATLTDLTAIVDGNLFALPAGDVKLALGADYRRDSLRVTGRIVTGSTVTVKTPTIADRDVWAAFGELAIPLIGTDERRVLEASIAARYEDYSDFGSTFDPKFGVSFMPADGIVIRSSWSTSFRAPRFSELIRSPSGGFVSLPDAQSPSGFTDSLLTSGTPVDNLGPETAKTWTIGFDAKPEIVPGLSLSATYFQLNYSNKIVDLAIVNPLGAPAIYASVINRSPTPAQVTAICNSPGFRGVCPAFADVDVILDLRRRNLAIVQVRGLDFDFDYRKDMSFGGINLGVAGTWLFRHSLAVSPTGVQGNVLNTFANPLEWKIRGNAGVRFGDWSLDTALNYQNAYDDPSNNRRIGSWTTIDAGIAYQASGTGWQKGLSIRLAATNLFDTPPPFANNFNGFDGANGNQTGRSVSLSITKQW